MINLQSLALFSCAICFGTHDHELFFVMLGMLSLPFLMVGGMFAFLYYKGAFQTTQVKEVME